MGVVYKARQISLNRPVALKMLQAAILVRPSSFRSFVYNRSTLRLVFPQIF
jgi:hypothetical protein